jgi:hypothetical protein
VLKVKPEHRNLDALIEALTIFRKYSNPEWPTNCGHDTLYVKGVDADQMSTEDVARLDELGFMFEEDEGWSSFVFGSC